MPVLDPAAARKELKEKSLLDIERATAITWGGRAAASFLLAREATDPKERLQRLQDGENYRQEALEHAAMTEDLELLVQVRKEMDVHRKPAMAYAA
jgi:hypothetical protein